MVMEIIISVILLFVGIAVLVVIHVCIVGRTFGRGNQGGGVMMIDMARRSNISNNMIVSNKLRMSIEDLKMIPCFDYVASEKAATASPVAVVAVDCAVCLESFKAGDKCRLLPSCRHSFHVQCIDLWLLKTPICPICRTCAKPPKIGVTLGEERSGIELA